MGYDFSGYATVNDLKCSDGATIRKGAFNDNNGQRVPLVWQHQHNDPANVIGFADLETRPNGTYARCSFNHNPTAQDAREAVKHGDINAMSIHANKVVKKNGNVLHGMIREVSLVLAGANPGALIDNVAIQHGDEIETVDDEVIIYTDQRINTDEVPVVEHAEEKEELTMADSTNTAAPASDDTTVQDVVDSMTEDQKKVLYYLVGLAVQGEGNGEATHYDMEDGMKYNVFESGDGDDYIEATTSLSHDQMHEIMSDAAKNGSLKDSVLFHAADYGITNIDQLFPDAKQLMDRPEFVKRKTDWVDGVISGTHHTPFSRVKSATADITLDTARAKGYVKGAMKKEEFFAVAKRTTGPTTIYKKQKLDRDDILDITDFDVVAWIKAEMRIMLDEEIARAILIGDGRDVESPDKIKDPGAKAQEGNGIRAIWTEAEFYATHVKIDKAATPDQFVDEVITAQDDLEGSGNPTLYASGNFVTQMLLQKNSLGERLYKSESELTSALGVSKIVRVPLFKAATRSVDGEKLNLLGIIINLSDYNVGTDAGGAVSMFDDFDIDFNQFKYLMETRCSGALIHPKSALVLEQVSA